MNSMQYIHGNDEIASCEDVQLLMNFMLDNVSVIVSAKDWS